MLSRKYDARFLEKGWWDKALSWCRGQGAHAIILWATPGGDPFIADAALLNLPMCSSYDTLRICRARPLGEDLS
jgi:hypothetical protein